MKYAVVLLFLLTSGVARADKAAEGRAAYDLHHWDDAIAAFKEAYKLDPQPEYLWRVSEAYERKGKCDLARSYFKAYVRTAGAKASGRLSNCGDDSDPALDVPNEGRDGPGRSTTMRNAGLGAAVVGILFTWGGVAATMNAREDTLAIKMLVTAGYDPETSSIRAYEADREKQKKTAVIAYSVGGAAIATAVGLLLWDRHEAHQDRRVTVVPTTGGATIEATIRF